MWRLGRSRGRALGSFGALSAVGIAFVFAVVIGAAIGYGLDLWLGTSPWLFLLFFFFGAAAGVLNVVRLAARAADERERGRPSPPAS